MIAVLSNLQVDDDTCIDPDEYLDFAEDEVDVKQPDPTPFKQNCWR